MMQRFCLLTGLFLLSLSAAVTAQQDTVAHRFILVGDAGKFKNNQHPELILLKSLYDLNDGRTTVVYLGDNVYPVGLPDSNDKTWPEKRMLLDNQADLVRGKKAEAYFLPGNHDWRKGRKDGLEQLMHQQHHIRLLNLPNVHFAPQDGCPGPVEVPVSDQITLLMIDSQWWFQREGRPGTMSDCDCKTEDELALAIKDALYRNRHKLVIFAMHHPFITYGEHGGYYKFKQHLFPLTDVKPGLYIPLPIIGSIYPLSRSWFGNIQDMPHPVYKSYIQKIDTLLAHHPYVIRVSGHEHTLQFIEKEGQYHIVSGAGSKTSQVRNGRYAKYVNEGTGFTVLEISTHGAVELKFFSSVASEPSKPVYATHLKNYLQTAEGGHLEPIPHFPDSVTMKAVSYYKANGFKKWLQGKNYRDEWSTPVKVAVIDIGKEKGGLTPTRRGGGMQSKSLRLEDAKGQEYVLRSIEKFPDKTLPEEFRQTFVKDVVVDGISASYPYSALSIPPLAEAAGVPHANPRLVYVPDDPRLLQYRSDFANTLCIFEEREPTEFPKTYSSPKVFEKLQEDNDNTIDQQKVLRARILDMFIMDFDRHEDQWRWAAADNGKGKTYFPIPRDRDQAFFTNSGVIPYMVSRPWIMPKFQGFRAKAVNINTFNTNGRYFDRSFLNGLSREQWSAAVDSFLPLMTDEVIHQALQQQPAEIRQQSAPAIVKKLQERRNYLKEEALQYYTFLAKEVDIVGSDKKEKFDITRNTDGSVQVIVYKINKDDEQSKELYNRLFLSKETKEIRLWGMGGDDQLLFHGDARNTICIRVIGGAGKDLFDNEATHTAASKTKIYDLRSEENKLSGNGSIANRFSSNPHVNYYDRKAYKYNIVAPLLSAAFNPDDGIFIGAGVKYTSHSFRKSPAAIHKLVVNHALATKAFSIKYSSDFRKVIGNTDVFVYANINAPDYVTNFFGLGNETEYDKKAPGKINYYRARYNKGDAAVLLKKEINNWLSIGVGPALQYFNPDEEDNKGRFLSATTINGLDPATLYKDKFYLGGQLALNIDNRDNEMMPSRGIYWQNSLKVLGGLNDHSKNLTQLTSDMALYMSFNSNAAIVIATRFGGGINFGDYEFFQAQYLGNTENLRGFRKYRFAGRSMLYNNTDIRLRIADFKTYILPGSIGLVAFNDVGRVWVKNDRSSEWHHGYGGGVWLGVAKRFIFTASVTTSKENTLPLLTVGYQF